MKPATVAIILGRIAKAINNSEHPRLDWVLSDLNRILAGITYKSAPEYASIEDFVQYLIDDERETYTAEDLQALNYRLKRPIRELREAIELEAMNHNRLIELEKRGPEKKSRGFTTNDMDRFYGPGSMPSYGGSGAEQITGFSGKQGSVDVYAMAVRVAAQVNIQDMTPTELDDIKDQIEWNVIWVKPSLKEEADEIKRVALEENLSEEEIVDAFKRGKLSTLSSDAWRDLDNHTRATSVTEAAKYSDEFIRDWKRIIQGFESGSQMPAPIVLRMPSGVLTLIAGNTRLMLAQAFGIDPLVWLVVY